MSCTVIKDCFNLYDKNRDGKVEKDELTKIMRALGHPVTHIEIFEIMKQHGKTCNKLLVYNNYVPCYLVLVMDTPAL